MGLNTLIVLGVVCYAAFLLLVSRTAGRIDPLFSAFIYCGMACLLPLANYFYNEARGLVVLPATQSGVLYSIMGGAFLSVFCVVIVYIFAKGGVAYTVPLIYGGTIGLVALAGWVLFREPVPLLQWFGIGVIMAGIGVIVYSRMQVSAG